MLLALEPVCNGRWVHVRLTRRELLAGATGTFLLSSCGLPLEAPEATPLFPLGVAAGDPTPDGVFLWTSYGGAQPLEGVLTRDGVELRTFDVTPADSVARAPVSGLQPDTVYGYSFREKGGGNASREGRFRTALAPGARRVLRFAGLSCIEDRLPMGPVQRAAEGDYDALLLLGDTAYLDPAKTVDQYRAGWAKALERSAMRDLRAAHACIATWDDHEFKDNWNRESLPEAQYEAGLQVFFESMPVPRQADPQRIWRSLRYGDVAEIFVLDCRSERRPSKQEYVSRAQLDWLEAGLASSPCTFKVILNSVPISTFSGAMFGLFVDDRWEGYPAQREELLAFIEDRKIGGVLWVSGDFHLASMGRVSTKGPGQKAIEALVGPGSQQPNPSPSYPEPGQFDWASAVNNYAVLELNPDTGEARIVYRDAKDRVLADRTYPVAAPG